MDFLKSWEIFNDLRFIQIIPSDKINELVKSEDPIGYKSENLPTPPNSAYHNLSPSEFPSGSNYMCQQPKVNFYPLYFLREVQPTSKVTIHEFYCDGLGDEEIKFYEFTDDWTKVLKSAMSIDSTSDTTNPKSKHVVFEFKGHARIRQWRHGIIQDRCQDDRNLSPMELKKCNSRADLDEPPHTYTYPHGGKLIPAPRIPTYAIVEASKKIFVEAVSSYNSSQLNYDTTYYGQFLYLGKIMYIIFHLELKLYSNTPVYVFVIESVIWHPKGYPPGSLPSVH